MVLEAAGSRLNTVVRRGTRACARKGDGGVPGGPVEVAYPPRARASRHTHTHILTNPSHPLSITHARV